MLILKNNHQKLLKSFCVCLCVHTYVQYKGVCVCAHVGVGIPVCMEARGKHCVSFTTPVPLSFQTAALTGVYGLAD